MIIQIPIKNYYHISRVDRYGNNNESAKYEFILLFKHLIYLISRISYNT